MVMIHGSGTIADYGSYISNCQLNQWPYRVPINSLSDVQLYISIGAIKPLAVEYQLIHTCGALSGTVESISPDYVVAQDTNNNWYGVFKNFTGASPVCFVIGITLTFEDESGDQIYFSEEYCIEDCQNLTLLKGCYGNLDNRVSYDADGIYFGIGQGAAAGDTSIVYKHELLIRGAEVYLSAIKNTFKQGRTRNFRTEKEKIYQFNAEIVPEWYLSEIDAVFYRGEVWVGNRKFLLNETGYELIEECKKQWLPKSTFKESKYQSFSCEADPCAPPPTECCDPIVVSANVTEVPFESGFVDSGTGNGAGGSNTVVIQSLVDGTPDVTGTLDGVTGITNGSTVITCSAFANRRIFMERGSVFIPGIDPEDGSNFYTKNFGDNFITLNTPLVTGELIYIETI